MKRALPYILATIAVIAVVAGVYFLGEWYQYMATTVWAI